MIDILYDRRHTQRPMVCTVFLGLVLVITLPSLVFAPLNEAFFGGEPSDHPWQALIAAFEPGLTGWRGWLQLAVGVYLIFECGVPCERLLGSRHFLALSVMALLATSLARFLIKGITGSSLVIWAWGPSLFLALLHARRSSPSARYQPAYFRLRRTLVLMYVVIPFLMPVAPATIASHGRFLYALGVGNVYHLVATAIGLAYAANAMFDIHNRLEQIAFVVKEHEKKPDEKQRE